MIALSRRPSAVRIALRTANNPRPCWRATASNAPIAGVVPDDDYFWQVARNQGFEVKHDYLGTNNRSKQDDAYLISEIVSTIYEKPGPSTIVLVADDADYMPPLLKVLAKGWRSEIAFIGHSVSSAFYSVSIDQCDQPGGRASRAVIQSSPTASTGGILGPGTSPERLEFRHA